MDEVASTFFHDLNLVLVDYLLLQYCKLSDPASSGKNKENLTTNYIVELDWTPETGSLIRAVNTEIMRFRAYIDDVRRKLIAHLDIHARLHTIDLGSFSSDEEAAFWRALQEFVDAAHEEAVGGPFDFKVAMQDGDVTSLIHCLRYSIDYSDLFSNDGAFLLSRHGQRRFDDA